MPDSGGAAGEQDGDAVDDWIAAIATGAAYEGRVERQGLVAYRADEESEVVGLEGHGDRVLGSRSEVRGKATTEILTLRARMTTVGDDGGARCGGVRGTMGAGSRAWREF
jgi:hypothetical protein